MWDYVPTYLTYTIRWERLNSTFGRNSIDEDKVDYLTQLPTRYNSVERVSNKISMKCVGYAGGHATNKVFYSQLDNWTR